jgi:hypothetical protein
MGGSPESEGGMKIVGRCGCGCVVAAMSEAEEQLLRAFAAEIVGAPKVITPPAPAVTEAPIATTKKEVRRTKKTATAKKGSRMTPAPATTSKAKSKLHACEVCGRMFGRKTSEKTCSPACRELRAQKQKADWKRKPTAQAEKPVPAAAAKVDRKCADCGAVLDNPKKIVCNPCASRRLRDVAGA